ncbi:hypothetical protein BDN70DRAFT_938841 [Pholiota conissans]|uniref:Uncharacterized protein n=1 Tax=Pholiota conissans TaxID=109636 RepID=A0A9P5YPH6_9AGAR|nr:hypothetical protein BDN70DRAFT_938841 [Pholiota conissans]
MSKLINLHPSLGHAARLHTSRTLPSWSAASTHPGPSPDHPRHSCSLFPPCIHTSAALLFISNAPSTLRDICPYVLPPDGPQHLVVGPLPRDIPKTVLEPIHLPMHPLCLNVNVDDNINANIHPFYHKPAPSLSRILEYIFRSEMRLPSHNFEKICPTWSVYSKHRPMSLIYASHHSCATTPYFLPNLVRHDTKQQDELHDRVRVYTSLRGHPGQLYLQTSVIDE